MLKHPMPYVLCLMFLLLGCGPSAPTTYTLFVGTFTQGDSEGLYQYTFDAETGALRDRTLAASLKNPSFLRISPDRKYLYTLHETSEGQGGLVCYRIVEGSLEKINARAAQGPSFCHVGISGDGRTLAASSYGGGSLAIFKVDGQGAFQPAVQEIDHSVLDTTRTSRAHAAKFTKDGLFVADLGLDALKRYKESEGRFVAAEQASLDLPEGAGPRHFTFSADQGFLYVINELNSTITVFERKSNGEYSSIATQNTLGADFEGKSYCADIHLSADGKFLYGSNRGENTIVVFAVDADSGKLDLVGRESVHGDWPRNFALDPSGAFLLVANQRSNNISVFQRDKRSGKLTYLHDTPLPSPVCLEFLD
ncbi:MAG: lactonase family protein [Bacteroidota bacterium]